LARIFGPDLCFLFIQRSYPPTKFGRVSQRNFEQWKTGSQKPGETNVNKDVSSDTEQRVALVTGAARGIGLATAKRFLAEGWRVALLDVDADTLAKTMAMFEDRQRVLGVTADVSDLIAVKTALDAVGNKFGRLDALVNNAGVAVFKTALDTTPEDWSRVMAVNLTGPLYMTQAAAPLLRERGGAIVNITSISGLRASTLRVAYGTSKAGLAHLTKQLAVELASAGIRVNAVAPGPVDTEMAKAVHSPEIRAEYHDVIPLNRYGLEAEIAEAVYFLCSDRASYVTGQVLAVDGGFDAAGIGLVTLRRDGRNS
jgi:NAD(P)-dependent dehydrogenase (short-subunit alcohol dehydrogenase family)